MIRIITDFDGPIMDVSTRYYRVYLFCLSETARPGQVIHQLSKAEFWRLKRSQVSERKIGILSGLDETQAHEFASLRHRTVHTLPYLKYDMPVPGAIAALERIQMQGIDLAVMTMRRVVELNAAFEQHNLARFFPIDRCYCLNNDYIKTADVDDKPLLMQRALTELPAASDTWMVGDTEADIIAAQKYSIKCIAVLSGIRDRNRLLQHQPNWITANLAEAVDLILQHSQVA